MSKLWRISGIYIVVVGIIHSAMSIVFTSQVWTSIFAGGVFNTIGSQFDRNAALFSLLFGVFLIYTGVCWQRQIRQTQEPLPQFNAWGLLIMAAFSVALMPVSGFWLVLPLCLIMLWPHWRKARK